jgi:hypothetical protein
MQTCLQQAGERDQQKALESKKQKQIKIYMEPAIWERVQLKRRKLKC